MKIGDQVKYLRYDNCEIVAMSDSVCAVRLPGGIVVNAAKSSLAVPATKPAPLPRPAKPKQDFSEVVEVKKKSKKGL
jgi:hypothetical protein